MEVDMEAEGVSSELGHKKADLEKPTEEERASAAKTPSEDHHDRARRRAMATEYDDDDDEYYDEPLPNPLDAYRQSWARSYGTNGATFEDETDLPPMPNTDIPVLPPSAQPMETMQVFTVKVTQITGGLRWPLGVYGVVAVRDSMDHKRNVLFRRGRNECQTLTSLQDSLLELIGPSRAILLFDNPLFEIDLKVKGQGPPSEDKALSYYAFLYNNICHRDKASYAITKVVPSDNSMMEIKFAHLAYAVEATIAIRIIGGSNSFSARFTARTKSIDEDMVLLDSRGRNVPIADDGLIALQRRIVVVEEKGLLILGVEATQGGAAENKTVVQQLKYRPRQALRSEAFFSLGFSRMHVLVAWSMLP